MSTFEILKANGFVGAAKRIEDEDIARVAHDLGCGEDELHAVIDVESAGGGFDNKKRSKMLREPHVFYRNLPPVARTQAVAQGLAYKDWRPGKYPADSYPSLYQALQIDETAALKSCSWGMGQILGENHLLAGYDSPQAMVVAFADDEDEHLEGMANFIVAKKLNVVLQRIARLGRPSTGDDWRPFAGPYNGAQYAVHGYHTRLAARHNWWRGKPDTPWPPRPLPEPVQPVQPPVAPPQPPAPQPPSAPTPWPRTGPAYALYMDLMEKFGDVPVD